MKKTREHRFRYYLPACILMLCLSACSPSGGESAGQSVSPADKSTAEQTTDADNSRADTESIGDETKADLQSEDSEIAKGFQFVRNLGICAPGHPVIYQMANLNTPEVKNEYGTAQLVNAFYQDGKAAVSVLFKDYSVYRLSEEETQAYLEEEKENREKQDQGEPVDWDNSYFCMDEDNQIYGRSTFLANLRAEKSKDSPEPYKGTMHIQGSEKPGYSFNRRSSTSSYGAYLEKGYVPILVQFIKDGEYPQTGGPDGVHELKLNYFDEPFIFEFQKVPEFDSLLELPGMTEQGGVFFYSDGEEKEGKFLLTCYAYSEEGYKIGLQHADVSVKYPQSDTEELTRNFDSMTESRGFLEIFTGVLEENMARYSYDLPEKKDDGQFTVTLNGMSMWKDSEIGTFTIPIPEDEEALDIKAEFPGGILSVTKVSRMEEEMHRGTDENGEEILEPQIYLTASVEDLENDKHVYMIYASDADREKDDSFFQYIYYADTSDPGISWYSRNIQGFKIPYEEDQENITIRFHQPSYQLDQQITLPINCDSGNFLK